MSDLFPEISAAPVPLGATDSWFTPVEVFDPLHAQYRFTLDPCGHAEAPVSQRIGRFYDIEADGLKRSWDGHRCWINPPFSDIAPWVEKAHYAMAFADRGGQPELVVMMVPANRTEQPWWQNFIERVRDGRGHFDDGFHLETRFLARRFKFGFPGDPEGKTSGSPTFGCALLIWRRK